MKRPGRRRTRAVAPVAAMAVALGAPACSASVPRSASVAPVLSVATALWPFAAAAEEIGGSKAAVVDVIPAGADPFTYQPTPAVTRIVQSAGLVVEGPEGLQPGVERSAAGAPRVLRLGAGGVPPGSYAWLDPPSMATAVKALEAAMAAADPAAAPLFERNAGALQDSIRSLDIDYRSTLAACPGTVIVTPDGAFRTMAADYGLEDHVVGPGVSPDQLAAEKSALGSGRRAAFLTEPWVDGSGVERLAAATGTKVHAVDTLAAPPNPGPAAQGTYLARMEQNLGVVSGGLGCSPGQ